MWQRESESEAAGGRKRSAPQRQQQPNFLLNEPVRGELYTEQTSFLACQDTLDVMMSYLPLRDVRSCRAVNVLWADTALQRLEGRRGEIARFVIAYNDEMAHRLDSKKALSLKSIGMILYFFMNLCPCAILPWLYLHTPWTFSWSVPNTVFDVLLGVLLAISLVVMIVGWVKVLPQQTFWLYRLGSVGIYFIAMGFFVIYLLANRWPEVIEADDKVDDPSVTDAPGTASGGSSDEPPAVGRFVTKGFFAWGSTVIIIFSVPVYVAMVSSLVLFVSQGMEIHRAQIRNPLSKKRDDNQGYFISLRRPVSIEEVEGLMWDDAEAKRREAEERRQQQQAMVTGSEGIGGDDEIYSTPEPTAVNVIEVQAAEETRRDNALL